MNKLEQAAKEYFHKHKKEKVVFRQHDFIAGAQWQAEQLEPIIQEVLRRAAEKMISPILRDKILSTEYKDLIK